MKNRSIYILMTGISLLLLIMIVVQFAWLRDVSEAQQKEKQLRVANALNRVRAQVENLNECYEAYSRIYFHPYEGFYLVKQGWDSVTRKYTGEVDTVRFFYDNEELGDDTVYSSRSNKFPIPVAMEIKMRYRLGGTGTNIFQGEEEAFIQNATGKLFRNYVSNTLPFDSIYNMSIIDSIIMDNLRLEKADTSYGYGLILEKEKKIDFITRIDDEEKLLKSPHSVYLFKDNKFMRLYRLVLVFPAKDGFAVSNWLLLSGCIIILLTFAFVSFLRLYLKQSRLSEMKSDFINNLTHEFNTPMANIALAVETLEQKGEIQNEKTHKVMSIIASESERLKDNIERALQVVTMEKGNLHLQKEDIDIVGMIETVLITYQMKSEQLGGNIRFQHPHTAIVYGDETHLLNCVCNLLDNAIKYRREAPEIKITVEEKEAWVVITVADNGQGMNSETQKHIFEKFYRAHSGNVHDTKGFGLGLNYVEGIVKAHGGKIVVHSRKGVGSQFIIHLPKSGNNESI